MSGASILGSGDGARGALTPPGAVSAALERRLRAGLWLLLAVFSFSGVFGHSLWGGNDAREGGMIWDMVRHDTLVTPTINGRPFLEKPPLLHWTGVAICRLAGRVNEGLVRLPAALYGFGTLVLIVMLVRGPRAGAECDRSREVAAWGAAFLCGTAIEFQEYARIVLTDMALVFTVTLALFAFWRAYLRPSSGRWLAFLLAAALSFYAKGLIGPVLIWASVGLFLLWQRRFRLLAGLAALYLPLLLLAILPWAVALARADGEAAVRFFFWDNQVGRFFHFNNAALPHDPFFINKEAWSYYLTNLPLYLAPWTLLIVPALVAWARRSSPFRTPFHRFVASGVVGMALVLQVSAAKVASYALPVYPLLFTAVALWLAEVAARGRATWLERWSVRLTAAATGLLLGLVPVALVVGTFVRPRLFRTGGALATGTSLALAVAALTLLGGAALLLVRLLRSPARALAAVAGPASYALIMVLAMHLVAPVLDHLRSYRPIADLAGAELDDGVAVALGTEQYRDVGAFTFYLDQRLPLLSGAAAAAFLRSPQPRAILVPRSQLPVFEAHLAGLPHGRLVAGDPGTVSRAWVLVTNAAELAAEHHPSEPAGGELLVARGRRIRGPRDGLASARQPQARLGGGAVRGPGDR